MPRISFNRKAAAFLGDINNAHYNQSFAGNALKITITKNVALPSDVDFKNVVARGQNFDYSETYQILPVLEWDTYFIQEIVLGMQEMGTFSIAAMFTLRLNDSLPNVKSLPFESEMQALQTVGQDSPNHGEVLNSWWGCRFVGRSSSQTPNGIVMDNIRGVYRYRLPGKEWKLINPSAIYPGDTKEVSLDDIAVPPVPTNS